MFWLATNSLKDKTPCGVITGVGVVALLLQHY
jgi:hypothetical protein